MFAVSADNSTCVNRTLQWRWLETQKFSNASVIDLQKKETARASMRKMVKHLLKKFKYPPVEHDTAISINTDVEAYIDNFPYNFQDRLQPLPFGGTKVQFYTPSLEDLVIAKLCSFRDTDKADVESEAVRNSLDWDLLEHLATDEDELRASILNDWRYRDFYIRYQEYVERWRPCES